MSDPRSARRHLDRWAVNQGFADFDTYLQAGGSFLWCRDDLLKRHADIDQCLRYIENLAGPAKRPTGEPEDPSTSSGHRPSTSSRQRQPPTADATIGPAALARLEAEHSDDQPGDATNAQIQGCDEHP